MSSLSPPPTHLRQKRPAELEDWLNRRLYHPAAWHLARWLVPTRVTPNFVSLLGASIVILAAWCYTFDGIWAAVLAGFSLHLLWHVVDGADGDLARLTGLSGPTGELVDGLSDIAGHVVLYLVLGMLAAKQIGNPWGWGLAISAGLSRMLQAAHYESSRRQYQHIVYGTPWLGSGNGSPSLSLAGRPFARLYVSIALQVSPQARALALAAQSEATGALLGAKLKQYAAALLRPMTPLSANYRTIAIGAAMLAGRPHWAFLFEVVVLNAVLAFSVVSSRRVVNRVMRCCLESR